MGDNEQQRQPIDKSAWGPGPWQSEPDRVEFEHAGFPCLIVRNMRFGNLCGYVAVPPGHPWHGKTGDAAELDVDVHGGLTFASSCSGQICHVPKPGQPDDVWWLGFDCGHGNDVMPGMIALLKGIELPEPLRKSLNERHVPAWMRESYKDVAYVREQCEWLAEQARAAVP